MKLENQIVELIAVGASITAHCQPCLEYHVDAALKCGTDGEQIAEAIEIGKRVRQGAASNMDKLASSLNLTGPTTESATAGSCACGS